MTKPFDLEAAKAGAPIITRSGVPVRFVEHLPKATEGFQIIVIAEEMYVYTYYDNGKMYDETGDDPMDLFMAPVKRTVWVNLIGSFCAENQVRWFDSQNAADSDFDRWREIFPDMKRLGNCAWQLEVELTE